MEQDREPQDELNIEENHDHDRDDPGMTSVSDFKGISYSLCSDEVERIALEGDRGSDCRGTIAQTMIHGQKYQSAIGASKPGRRNYYSIFFF